MDMTGTPRYSQRRRELLGVVQMRSFGTVYPGSGEVPDGVYIYVYVIDGLVRYIGKGREDRPWDHIYDARSFLRGGRGRKKVFGRFAHKLAVALEAGSSIRILISEPFHFEEDALLVEEQMIRCLEGRGLWNIAPGGVGLDRETAIKVNSDPTKRAKSSDFMKAAWQDPDFRERSISARIERWKRGASEGFRKKMRDAWTPERRAAMAERLRLKSESMTPEERSARAKACFKPETHAKMQAASSAARKSPEARAKQAEISRKAWADPNSGLRRASDKRRRAD